MSGEAPRFTGRQEKDWQEIVVPTLERHAIIANLRTHYWTVTWAGEVRPGRGNHFNATYCDSEHYVQVLMDVYGYPSISVAELDWIHADADEEAECETCVLPPEASTP